MRDLFLQPVYPESLKSFAQEALLRTGVTQEAASVTAEVLVTTDTWGIHTHGTYQLYNYIKKIRAKGIDPKAVPELISEGPGFALIDGKLSLAMHTSCMAMEVAIEKAASAGIALVGVRNSNHFGAAGYYANLAIKHDMIGIAMSNGNPNMTVPGARGSIIGNNPFAYAVPTGDGQSIFLDIATSTVASSKVWSAKNLGKEIPDNWIVDEEGIPTTDLEKYPTSCSLQPMGGHKGYGLAVMIEILAAVLTGASVVNEVESWVLDLPDQTKMGHAFIAIDVSAIHPLQQFQQRIEKMVRTIRSSPKAKGSDRILLPGEREWEQRDKSLREGMLLPEDVMTSLVSLAQDLELDLLSLFQQEEATIP
jgi:ureidoglycolate dehydrogenase (NAD+)